MNDISSALKRALVRFMILFIIYILAAVVCLFAAKLSHAQRLSAGRGHTCAIDNGGGVQCWGYNSSGQLGDGLFADRALPARVISLDSGVVAVVATSVERSCALRSNGEVVCWGRNFPGTPIGGAALPSPVAGLAPGSGATAIALGTDHACALKSDGALLCWGSNQYGQIGKGTTGGASPPTPVGGLRTFIAVATGVDHTCAVQSDQAVYCWGRNFAGALGDGTLIDRDEPTSVQSLGAGSGVVSLSAGYGYTCAVRSDGALFCWGYNGYGEIGDGTATSTRVPTLILGASAAVAGVDGFYYHTCARTRLGMAYCWGFNGRSQLGDGTAVDRYSPALVPTAGTGVDGIATGGFHSCVRKSGGTVLCWGANFSGQLGNGTYIDATVPQVVTFGDLIFRSGFE